MEKFDAKVAFGDNYQLYRDTWVNNGVYAPTGTKIGFKDFLATPNANIWLPKVVEDIAREPVEPMLVVASLLDRVQFSGSARITFPALGAITAADIAEGQAYPEQTLNVAPGSVTVTTGKSGVAFKISEEMRRNSMFDVINLHIRAARRALDRHKEKKGMDFISGMGVTLFDNKNPESSVYGTCTGRSISGAGNGSCRMEDLMKAYAHIMMQGFTPDTILLHPLAWSMWMVDPLLQTIVKNTGSGSWFQPHSMPKSAQPWSAASQGGRGIPSGYGAFTPGGNAAGETPTSVNGLDQNLNSAAVIPSYFPHPLRVIVSPFVPFDVYKQTCDIMVFDSRNLGALLVEEDVTVDQWDDMSTDITKIKLKERYAFSIYEDGLAVGVLRNIPIKANEIALPVSATISAAGSLSELDITSPISGL
jgi:hypothetical protein